MGKLADSSVMGPAKGRPNDRLIAARKKAGFKSKRQAAIKNRWNPSTYASHENGQTPLPRDAAITYGKAFKVRPQWLLYLEGTDMRRLKEDRKTSDAKNRFLAIADQIPPEMLERLVSHLEIMVQPNSAMSESAEIKKSPRRDE